MLEHHAILKTNPFTFSAPGVPWLDHEWLFQVGVALIERLGSGPALIGLRIAVAVMLVFLLTRFGRRAGLSPAVALTLACLCVAGARMRFFIRPELATLIIVPVGVALFLDRSRRSTVTTAGMIALLAAVGINFHGAVVILPVILGALVLAETIETMIHRRSPLDVLGSGIVIVAATIAGTLLNPWGAAVLTAPLHLADLVGKPWIPNPEWISPGPADVPALWIALGAAWITLGVLKDRRPTRWMLLLVISVLALRYVRNVGLFFVLLPLAVAPALARIAAFRRSDRRASLAAAATILLLGALMIDRPRFPLGWGFSSERYPIDACLFLERTGLIHRPIYNDVRFGGWLVGRYFPPVRAFIDDRNEIHEKILEEIWDIQRASSPKRWQAFLEGYGIECALLRYHDPLRVDTPDGRFLGYRGFSALWFPPARWALVHWDDTAMILVDRRTVPDEFLEAFALTRIRPDDGLHLEQLARSDPAVRRELLDDLARKLAEDPDCRRARDLMANIGPP